MSIFEQRVIYYPKSDSVTLALLINIIQLRQYNGVLDKN